MGRQSGFCKAEGWDAFCFEVLINDDVAVLVPIEQLDPVAALVPVG
jgi:hypothetical protein